MHQKEKDQALAEARQFRIKFKHLEGQMKDEITQLTGKKNKFQKMGFFSFFPFFFLPLFWHHLWCGYFLGGHSS